MFGVRSYGCPVQRIESARCWSVIRMRMWGRVAMAWYRRGRSRLLETGVEYVARLGVRAKLPHE